MKNNEVGSQVAVVVRACQSKKAEDISVLQLDAQASGFTDYFVLCSGVNPRQVQAIADEIDHKLSAIGVQPKHIEGYNQADWLLMDYVDFVVHIFSESARKFYDLERLWKTATRRELADLEKPAAQAGGEEGCQTTGRQAGKESCEVCAAKARLNQVSAREFLSRETAHRLDRPYQERAYSISDGGISQAAVTLRRVRRARAVRRKLLFSNWSRRAPDALSRCWCCWIRAAVS